VTAGPAAGVWDLSNGRNLFLLRPPDRLLLTAVAFSPAGFRIATGGRDGNVGTYECQLCGGIRKLVQLAEARLERVHTAGRGR
jgi:WD40 repeat protein